MKKIFLTLIFILFIFVLTGCHQEITYDDLYLKYKEHIENNSEIYQLDIDYFNQLSSTTIKSVVLVEKLIIAAPGSATGSGVIIKSDANFYYVLTNNHVIFVQNDVQFTYSISDYKGNKYTATLVAQNQDYDLAILKFSRGNLSLNSIELAPINPDINHRVAVLGYPTYQINAITIGNTIEYSPIDLEGSILNVINVMFDVLISDVPVKSGSSGSVVINDDFQLVGLIYAGNFVDDSESSEYSFAIPVEKVYEFFQLAGFSLGVQS